MATFFLDSKFSPRRSAGTTDRGSCLFVADGGEEFPMANRRRARGGTNRPEIFQPEQGDAVEPRDRLDLRLGHDTGLGCEELASQQWAFRAGGETEPGRKARSRKDQEQLGDG